jgi:hypothetical protein
MEGEPMHSSVNPALVKVSIGDLPLSADFSITYENGELTFTWNTELPTGGSLYDQLMPLAYKIDESLSRVHKRTASALRKSGTDSLGVDPTPGGVYHVYVAFTSEDRSRNSDSLYLGEVTIV